MNKKIVIVALAIGTLFQSTLFSMGWFQPRPTRHTSMPGQEGEFGTQLKGVPSYRFPTTDKLRDTQTATRARRLGSNVGQGLSNFGRNVSQGWSNYLSGLQQKKFVPEQEGDFGMLGTRESNVYQPAVEGVDNYVSALKQKKFVPEQEGDFGTLGVRKPLVYHQGVRSAREKIMPYVDRLAERGQSWREQETARLKTEGRPVPASLSQPTWREQFRNRQLRAMQDPAQYKDIIKKRFREYGLKIDDGMTNRLAQQLQGINPNEVKDYLENRPMTKLLQDIQENKGLFHRYMGQPLGDYVAESRIGQWATETAAPALSSALEAGHGYFERLPDRPEWTTGRYWYPRYTKQEEQDLSAAYGVEGVDPVTTLPKEYEKLQGERLSAFEELPTVPSGVGPVSE